MTQVYTASGKLVPCTVLKAAPCVVVQIKQTKQQIQLGTGEKKQLKKPIKHHLLKHQVKQNLRYLKSFPVTQAQLEQLKPGQSIAVDQVFQAGDIVAVQAISKGKGFAGVVKRHGFAGGPKTHGQSDRHRAPGSIGAGTTPGRVLKGKKMAGRMGGQQVFIRNLKVVTVDAERQQLVLSGSIPGSRHGLVVVHKLGHQDQWQTEFATAGTQLGITSSTDDSTESDSNSNSSNNAQT